MGYPAHAGIDLRGKVKDVPYLGLPRTRGDRPYVILRTRRSNRATPHTRGSTSHPAAQDAKAEGYPAHAGIDRSYPQRSGSAIRLPRTRGDRPPISFWVAKYPVATPYTRGSTSRQGIQGRGFSGYPAHAGIDPQYVAIIPMSSGLPRTRGDRPVRR